ncbi:MAG TPA: type II toxin-antitoxin system PemK/MazF family toxin [Afifellaceae bacterium]|nr:type II toxin-antitoxin system PemK/MazF family toxin [Afifellaceae bacterium]
MRRGEVWTASGGSGYAGKPRPVVIVQDDRFAATASVTICGFTTAPIEAELARPLVAPTSENGLRVPSRLMADKITTLPRRLLRDRIGRLSEEEVQALNRSILVFLGLAE